jgi:hypothetical protein
MTYENDPNRLDNRSRAPMRSGMGWGIPLAIAAIVLIAGLLFMSPNADRTTTASNTPATTTQTNPSGPARTAPAPTPAPATAPTKTP